MVSFAVAIGVVPYGVTLEDDIDDSTLFSAKVYDVIYPLLEKFTNARGLWFRDVGFWVNEAITKLTTNERAGCMGMEENDQILVRLNGRRRLVVAAEGEGQRHLLVCVGGTRWKTARDFFKVRPGAGFVMLHDGQRVGAKQRISTSTALGIVRAQQGGGGAPRPSEWGKRLELPAQWVVRNVADHR